MVLTVCIGRMLQRYGSLPGQLEMVELDRSRHSSGLGLSVTGSRDGTRGRMSVYVSEVQPEGAAAVDGRIRVGDELLEVGVQAPTVNTILDYRQRHRLRAV